MNYRDNRLKRRYDTVGLNLIADYSPIPLEYHPILDMDTIKDIHPEDRPALVHNLSLSGICLSVADPDLCVGSEIHLALKVADRQSETGTLVLEWVARVIWISEEPVGFRCGLHFVEVPEDYARRFDRLMALLEKDRLVSG